MSVIPWIIDGDNRNVVDSWEDFEATGGREGGVVLVINFDTEQFHLERDTNVSYDLRVGPQFRRYEESGTRPLPEEGTIKLRPGRSAIIQTEEEIYLVKSVFGHILPKESLLQQGV